MWQASILQIDPRIKIKEKPQSRLNNKEKDRRRNEYIKKNNTDFFYLSSHSCSGIWIPMAKDQ
jgi:hypothetical protein